MNNLKQACINTVTELCDKYKDNEHMLRFIDTQINTVLDKTVSTEYTAQQVMIERTLNLEVQQNNFVKVFLSKNRYYYLSQNDTECFYEYDGKHYSVAKKDDIIHKLLVTISSYKDLHEWKFEVTDVIMKYIKERSLYETVPESSTIQYVLKLLVPSIFSTREEAKYFLTILGDNIFKKNKEHIYLAYGKCKPLLTLLDQYAYMTVGHSGITKNFLKYHETHNYADCRLIHFKGERETEVTVNQSLDLFCVACHYSSRFKDGDEYLQKKATEQLRKYTLFLKNQSQQEIVDDFCEDMIDNVYDSSPSQSLYTLKLKDVHYLWKSYLSKYNLPNMIYFNAIKQLMTTKYDYDSSQELFANITSKELPIVRKLIDFWEKHITITKGDELEIDELCILFKTTCGPIEETETLKIICHFFPDTEVVETKYIMNISCNLWMKKEDITNSMLKLCSHYKTLNTQEFISFDDAYQYYCNTYKPKYIASKRYFENFIRTYVSKHIVYGTFISNSWYN
jgi:hypothetical protein